MKLTPFDSLEQEHLAALRADATFSSSPEFATNIDRFYRNLRTLPDVFRSAGLGEQAERMSRESARPLELPRSASMAEREERYKELLEEFGGLGSTPAPRALVRTTRATAPAEFRAPLPTSEESQKFRRAPAPLGTKAPPAPTVDPEDELFLSGEVERFSQTTGGRSREGRPLPAAPRAPRPKAEEAGRGKEEAAPPEVRLAASPPPERPARKGRGAPESSEEQGSFRFDNPSYAHDYEPRRKTLVLPEWDRTLIDSLIDANEALIATKQEEDETPLTEEGVSKGISAPTVTGIERALRTDPRADEDSGLFVDLSHWDQSGVVTAYQRMQPSADGREEVLQAQLIYLNRLAPEMADLFQQAAGQTSIGGRRSAGVPVFLIHSSLGASRQFVAGKQATIASLEFDDDRPQNIPTYLGGADAAMDTFRKYIRDVETLSGDTFRERAGNTASHPGALRFANSSRTHGISVGTTFSIARSLRAPGLHRGVWDYETTIQAGEYYVVESAKFEADGSPVYVIKEAPPSPSDAWRAKVRAEVLDKLVPARRDNPSLAIPAAYALTSAVGLSAALYDLASALRAPRK